MVHRWIHQALAGKRSLPYVVCLFLVIGTVAVYSQVRHFEFINFDDHHYIVDNPDVRTGWTLQGLRWALTATRSMNWHPITWLSHMSDSELYGLNAGAHHLTNLLFHVFNVLLLFVVLRKMSGDLWKSAFVAALFAVHPLNLESVAWVSQRKTLLSTLFLFLALWSYFDYVRHRSVMRYGRTLLVFVLGLMSKPMVVTVPFLLLLIDYWPLGRYQNSRVSMGYRIGGLVLEKSPLFALSIASSAMTYLVQHGGGATSSFAILPLAVRVSNAVVSYTAYIGKLIWPFNPAVLYPHPRSVEAVALAGAVLLLGAISVYAVACRHAKPHMLVGWLWYLGTLVPVIGIIQVGVQSMADRYAYVPLIGLFILMVWDLESWFKKRRLPVFFGVVIPCGMLLYFGITSAYYLGFWSDGITLYRHSLSVTEKNFPIHHNLALALAQRGRYSEARFHFEEALRIEPGFQLARKGLMSLPYADDDDMARLFGKIQIDPASPEPYVRLGNLFKRQGSLQKAMVQYQRALKKQSDYTPALKQLGIVHAMLGDYQQAEDRFIESAARDPKDAESCYLLAGLYARQKKTAEALYWLQKVGRIGPLDRKRIAADPNLDGIRGEKAFIEFLKQTPDKDAAESGSG